MRKNISTINTKDTATDTSISNSADHRTEEVTTVSNASLAINQTDVIDSTKDTIIPTSTSNYAAITTDTAHASTSDTAHASTSDTAHASTSDTSHATEEVEYIGKITSDSIIF